MILPWNISACAKVSPLFLFPCARVMGNYFVEKNQFKMQDANGLNESM